MHDYSLFIKSSNDSLTTILMYVDDISLTGNDNQEITQIKKALDASFCIKNLGTYIIFLVLRWHEPNKEF